MKVLIILYGSPGEIVFSTVLIRAFKIQFPDTYIAYLTDKRGKNLLFENQYVDKLVVFDGGQDYTELKRMRFNYVIDLKVSLKTFFFSLRVTGKKLRLEKRLWEKWLLTRLRINKMIPTHIADQFISAAARTGVTNDGLRPDYPIPYKDQVPTEWLPEPFRDGFVVFCISASHGTRKLPEARMIELCDRINKPVILLGSADDAPAGDRVERFFARKEEDPLEAGLLELNKKTIVYNACGKFNFNQQASLVKQARYVFAFDNEFLAISSAFGKETFVLYGSSVTDFGNYPVHTRFTIFENNRLTCRPCAVGGHDQCPLKHFKCMNELVFDFYLS